MEAIGRVCEMVLPIPERVFYGNARSPVAVCTLSSMPLLRELAGSGIMEDVAMAGRLLSENKGIDSLVSSVIQNPNISTIVVCGKDVWGHKAGLSLISLHKNGISQKGRIVGSPSPDPVLATRPENIAQFQRQVTCLVNKIGETDSSQIIRLVQSLV